MSLECSLHEWNQCPCNRDLILLSALFHHVGAQREGIGCLQPGRGLLSEPSHLAILSWTFNLHKCEKLVSIVYKSPRLRFSVIVAAHSCLPL